MAAALAGGGGGGGGGAQAPLIRTPHHLGPVEDSQHTRGEGPGFFLTVHVYTVKLAQPYSAAPDVGLVVGVAVGPGTAAALEPGVLPDQDVLEGRGQASILLQNLLLISA